MSSDSRPTLSRTPAPPPLSRHRPRAAPHTLPSLSASPPPLPRASYPLAQDLLHAPVSRTPGSRARYFSQFTQIRCPARAFRL